MLEFIKKRIAESFIAVLNEPEWVELTREQIDCYEGGEAFSSMRFNRRTGAMEGTLKQPLERIFVTIGFSEKVLVSTEPEC